MSTTCVRCGVSLRYLPASWVYCSPHCREEAAKARRLAAIDERAARRLDKKGVKARREHQVDLARPTIPYDIATKDPYARMKRRKEART